MAVAVVVDVAAEAAEASAEFLIAPAVATAKGQPCITEGESELPTRRIRSSRAQFAQQSQHSD